MGITSAHGLEARLHSEMSNQYRHGYEYSYVHSGRQH